MENETTNDDDAPKAGKVRGPRILSVKKADDRPSDLTEAGTSEGRAAQIAQIAQTAFTDEPATGNPPANGGIGGTQAPKAYRDVVDADALGIRDYIMAKFPEISNFKVVLRRDLPERVRDPKTQQMVSCKGHLGTYNEMIDEQWISETHGGGEYTLVFQAPNPKRNGQYEILTRKKVSVAGDPNLMALPRIPDAAPVAPPAPAQAESATLAQQALSTMKSELDRAHQLARDAARAGGGDPSMISDAIGRAVGPLERQITQLIEQLARKDAQLIEIQNRPPPQQDPFKDQMLSRMLEGESARITALRTQYESEIRTIKESHVQETARIYDRHEREREQANRAFERELASLKQSHEIILASTSTGSNTQIEIYKERVRQNEREIDSLKGELKDLKSKKDKTMLDMVNEVNGFKEALGVDDDGKDKSLIERGFEVLTNPDAMREVGKIIRPGSAAATPAPTPAPPPQQPPQVVQGPRGEKFVLVNGQLVPAKKRAPRPGEAAGSTPAAPGQAQTAEDVPPQEEIPQIPEALVADAIHKLELAFHNSMDPAAAAALAKDQVPPEVISAIETHGVDGFMRKVAKLPNSSPFTTQQGRMWLRAFGKALVE